MTTHLGYAPHARNGSGPGNCRNGKGKKTEAILDEVRTWQSRPLASVYPILYFDALFVKSRQEGPVHTKAVYVALGITLEGEKELLGLWLSETEGAKF